MYGLAVIEVVTMSGHLSNIDEIMKVHSKHFQQKVMSSESQLPTQRHQELNVFHLCINFPSCEYTSYT